MGTWNPGFEVALTRLTYGRTERSVGHASQVDDKHAHDTSGLWIHQMGGHFYLYRNVIGALSKNIFSHYPHGQRGFSTHIAAQDEMLNAELPVRLEYWNDLCRFNEKVRWLHEMVRDEMARG